MFGFARWLAAGSVAGLIGAAVWAGITYATNYEVGFVAWGIGFLVGFCVRLSAGEAEEGFAPGVTAAAIALVAVLGGKYAAAHLQVASLTSGITAQVDDNDMIVVTADEIIREREAKGQTVSMPGGKTIEDATSQADYPPAIWAEAEKSWQALSSEERTERKAEEIQIREAMVRTMASSIRGSAFTGSFSFFDALWFFLAAGTAYKLGHGNIASDE